MIFKIENDKEMEETQPLFTTEEEAELIPLLNAGKVILFLGVGFSVNAKNIKGETIPSAANLAEQMNEILVANKEKSFVGENIHNLKLVSNSFYRFYKESPKVIDNFFKSNLTVDKTQIPLNYHNLKKVNWNGIYTTNYDDLLESIYVSSEGGKISFKKSVFKRINSDLPLDKNFNIVYLNGDLNSNARLAETNDVIITDLVCSINDFATNKSPKIWDYFMDKFRQYSIIIVGSQLEEDSFYSILGDLINKTNIKISDRPKSYIINLDSHDQKFIDFERAYNLFHKKEDTNKFLEWIASKPELTNSTLIQGSGESSIQFPTQGTNRPYQFYEEVMIFKTGSENSHRNIYEFPLEIDFTENRVYQDNNQIDEIKKLLKSKNGALFIADEGRGKTTLSRTLAYNFKQEGYQVIFIEADKLNKETNYCFLNQGNNSNQLIIIDNCHRNTEQLDTVIAQYQDHCANPTKNNMFFLFFSRELGEYNPFKDETDTNYILPLIKFEKDFARNLIAEYFKGNSENENAFKNELPDKSLNENTNLRFIGLCLKYWNEKKYSVQGISLVSYIRKAFLKKYDIKDSDIKYQDLLLSIASIALFDIPFVPTKNEKEQYHNAFEKLLKDKLIYPKSLNEYSFPHSFDAYFLCQAFYKDNFAKNVCENVLDYLITINNRKSDNLDKDLLLLISHINAEKDQYGILYGLLRDKIDNNFNNGIQIFNKQPIILNYYLRNINNDKEFRIFWNKIKDITRVGLVNSNSQILNSIIQILNNKFNNNSTIINELVHNESEMIIILNNIKTGGVSSLIKAIEVSKYSDVFNKWYNKWCIERENKHNEHNKKQNELAADFNILPHNKIPKNKLIIDNRFVREINNSRVGNIYIHNLNIFKHNFIFANINCRHLVMFLNKVNKIKDNLNSSDKYFVEAITLIKMEPENINKFDAINISLLLREFRIYKDGSLVKGIFEISKMKQKIIYFIQNLDISDKSIGVLPSLYFYDMEWIVQEFRERFKKLSNDEIKIINEYYQLQMTKYKGNLTKNGLFSFILEETAILPC